MHSLDRKRNAFWDGLLLGGGIEGKDMFRRGRRVVWWVAVWGFALVVAGTLTVGLALYTQKMGLQRWIGSQVVGLANSYLVPQLSFDEVEYRWPKTVVFANARLTADDPRRPGAKFDVLTIRELTLELAETPQRGRPVRMQKVLMKGPVLKLVRGERDGKGFIAGLEPLLQPTQHRKAATREKDDEVSRAFELRLVEISDGKVVYDPGRPGKPRMEVDGLTTQLNVVPAGGSAERGIVQPATTPSEGGQGERGWYKGDFSSARPPVLDLKMVWRFNMDRLILETTGMHVSLQVGREQDHFLPPDLQKLLAEHEVSGRLEMTGDAVWPLEQWRASDLRVVGDLTKGHFAQGRHRWPVESLNALWVMKDGVGRMERCEAAALGGQVKAVGRVNLRDLSGEANLKVEHVRLEQTLREARKQGQGEQGGQGGEKGKGGKEGKEGKDGKEGEYKGDLSGEVAWRGVWPNMATDSHGQGNLHIVGGQLTNLPVIGELLSALRGAMKVVGVSSENDTAAVDFTLDGDRAHLKKIDVATSWADLHGKGDIYLNGRLDLRFNGGPVEKAESLLGPIGSLIGSVTDQLTEYRMTGTVGHEEVGLKVVPAMHLP